MIGCHICDCPKVDTLPQVGMPFRLVSSDVQPVSGTAEDMLCSNCLTVKAVTPAWQAMADGIYASYDINHQVLGAEPMIFDTAEGSGPRSLILLRNFLDRADLPANGGCSMSAQRKPAGRPSKGCAPSGSFREPSWSTPGGTRSSPYRAWKPFTAARTHPIPRP